MSKALVPEKKFLFRLGEVVVCGGDFVNGSRHGNRGLDRSIISIGGTHWQVVGRVDEDAYWPTCGIM